MSRNDTYLAVFLSTKTSPRWRAWYAMSDDERGAKDGEGLAALKAWDEKHRDAIVYGAGRLAQPSARRGMAWRTSSMS
jgi:hypothetical protein